MKAIEQPVYDNSDLSNSDAWLMRNLRPFMNYMTSLGVTDFDEIMELSKIQYDRQVLLDRAEFELQLSYQLAQVAQ
jgi:hypothetical protein